LSLAAVKPALSEVGEGDSGRRGWGVTPCSVRLRLPVPHRSGTNPVDARSEIVYERYGLTDEEIEIVEESVGT
jgi:hypothetical protein